MSPKTLRLPFNREGVFQIECNKMFGDNDYRCDLHDAKKVETTPIVGSFNGINGIGSDLFVSIQKKENRDIVTMGTSDEESSLSCEENIPGIMYCTGTYL